MKMENAEWVEAHLRRKLTPFQARCAEIVGLISSGAHNAPVKWESVEWEWGGKGVMVLWGRGCLCTWDFCNLTPLVFLCHDARIRLEISPASPDKLRLVFFQRQAAGKIMQRHPDMTEALADHLRWIPDGHPLLWRNHPEREFEKVAEGFKTVGQRRRERELTERPTDADREANPGLMSGAEIDEQERVANREAMNAATKLNASHFNEIRIAQIKNGTPAMTPDERAYLIETIPRFEECSVTREQLAAMNDRALMDESYSVWADYASTQI